jgi:hypothetical protein
VHIIFLPCGKHDLVLNHIGCRGVLDNEDEECESINNLEMKTFVVSKFSD